MGKKKQMCKVRCFSDKRYDCFDQDLNTHSAPSTHTCTNVIEVQKVLEDLVLIILVTLRKQLDSEYVYNAVVPSSRGPYRRCACVHSVEAS